MLSIEGEEVELFKPVNVVAGDKKGNVEKWLLEVQDSMIGCLTQIIGEAYKVRRDPKGVSSRGLHNSYIYIYMYIFRLFLAQQHKSLLDAPGKAPNQETPL